jgi:hypothetical protein
MFVDIGPTSSSRAEAAIEAVAVRRARWIPVLSWAAFATALLVEAFAPRLAITNNAFVMPPSLVAEGKQLRPAELVARERSAQVLSALLALSGALGLAFHYRAALIDALRSPGDGGGARRGPGDEVRRNPCPSASASFPPNSRPLSGGEHEST